MRYASLQLTGRHNAGIKCLRIYDYTGAYYSRQLHMETNEADICVLLRLSGGRRLAPSLGSATHDASASLCPL